MGQVFTNDIDIILFIPMKAKYVLAEVMLLKGDALECAHIVNHKQDNQGNPIGEQNSNPILDTHVYDVQFADGHVEEFSANIIAESLYSQVDCESNQFLILQEIGDHKKDGTAISCDDMWLKSQGGNQHMQHTTKGWRLCITTLWELLCNLKESNPVQVTEYAVANKIVDEPAFAWWIKDILCHCDHIIHAI